MCVRSFGVMPDPASATAKTVCCLVEVRAMRIVLPRGLNLRALSTRLYSASRRMSWSIRAAAGLVASIRTLWSGAIAASSKC